MTASDPTVRTVPDDVDPMTERARAVAARIGDRPLWLGNRGAAQPGNLDEMGLEPAAVVSVNKRPTAATTDHHPLVDARVNDQAAFTDAVETARERYREEGPVLVNCAAGISRSTTVVATVLAVEEGLSFDEGVDIVQRSRKRAAPHPTLQINAQSYLTTVHDRDEARAALERLAEQVHFGRDDDPSALAPIRD